MAPTIARTNWNRLINEAAPDAFRTAPARPAPVAPPRLVKKPAPPAPPAWRTLRTNRVAA